MRTIHAPLAFFLVGLLLWITACTSRVTQTEACRQVDVQWPNAAWEGSVVFEKAGRLWRIDLEELESSARFVLREIVAGGAVEVSQSIVDTEGGGRFFSDFSSPVIGWGGRTFVAVFGQSGSTAILSVDEVPSLSIFWTGRFAIRAGLGFSRQTDCLVLADGALFQLIRSDGTATSIPMDRDADAIAEVGDRIIVGSLGEDLVVVGPEGSQPPQTIRVDGAMRAIAGVRDYILVLVDSTFLGRPRLDVAQVSGGEPVWRSYALGAGPWKMSNGHRISAVYNPDMREILVTDGRVTRRVSWQPTGTIVDVVPSDSEDRLVALTTSGYSILTLGEGEGAHRNKTPE